MRFRPGLLLLAASFLALSPTAFLDAQSAKPQAGPSAISTDQSPALQRQRDQMRIQQAIAKMRAHPNAVPHTSSGSSGIIETIAGSAPFQQPITALKAGLGFSNGLVEDAIGNLYVSAAGLRTVLKIDSAENVSVYAGRPLPTGPFAASGDGEAAASATLVAPGGLALDASNNLYIGDSLDCTVRKVNATTGIISTIAGQSGVCGYSGDGGAATSAQLDNVSSVALDDSGNLYLAQTNYSAAPTGIDSSYIRKVDLSSGVITTFAGAGTTSAPSCSLANLTSACPATSINLLVAGSQSVLTTYMNTLYVSAGSDGLKSGAVLAIQLNNGSTTVVAGGGLGSPSSAAVGSTIDPEGVAVDASGDLDITSAEGVIYQLPKNGTVLNLVAGTAGTQGYSGDGGPATAAKLDQLSGVNVTPSGNLVFADTSRIRQIDRAGTISTVAGDGSSNAYGDGGPAQAAGLSGPAALAVDAQGNVYIADQYNNLVRVVSAVNANISTIAGNGEDAPYDIGNTTSVQPGDGGPATQAAIGQIAALAVDNNAHLYLGSEIQGIRVVNTGTGVISTLNDQLVVTGGLIFDGGETLYAGALQNQSTVGVFAINVTTGAATLIAGGGTSFDVGIPATEASLEPSSIALDGNENLYIGDLVRDQIFIVNLTTGILENFAGPGNGQYSGDGGLATAAGFDGITGLGYDGAGDLEIADALAGVVRQVNLSTNIITTVAGNGVEGYTGDGSNALNAELAYPNAVAADASGTLLISDTTNDRVRRVSMNLLTLTPDLTASSTGLQVGSALNVTATFSGAESGITPIGVVSFMDGSTLIGTVSLTAAPISGTYSANLTDSSFAIGTHRITAQYEGDLHYAPIITTAVTIKVTALNLKALITTSATTFNAGTNVTLTSILSGAQSGIAPTGSVTFLDGTTSIGTGLLTASSAAGSYVATLTNNTLAAGTHSITAQYPGDANYAPVTTAAVVLTVTAPIPPSYAVAANPSSLSIAQGSTGTTVLTVTPAGGFNQAVNFNCGTGLPTGVSCSFSPTSVTPSGTASVTTTLTITTTGTSTAALVPNMQRKARWWLPTSVTSLACLLMLGVPRVRRRGIWLALLVAILVAGANGCGSGGSTSGGGGGGGGGGNTNPNATPPGNYSIKLATTAGTGASAESQPLTLSVTVTD